MTKLISMTEFVLLQKVRSVRDYNMALAYIAKGDFAVASEVTQHADCFSRCVRYAHFLSRSLSLDMFVPSDQLKGLPGGKSEKPGEPDDLFPELNDKLLFKDLQIKYTDLDKKFYITKKDSGFFVISGPKSMFGNNLTIESLVHRDLELTGNAVKLIFG